MRPATKIVTMMGIMMTTYNVTPSSPVREDKNRWCQVLFIFHSSAFHVIREKFITFRWRHIEENTFCPGAVSCRGSGTHSGGVVPRAKVG